MKFFYLLLFGFSLGCFAQSNYQITSYLTEGFRAPNSHYIGDAWLNGLLQEDEELPYSITKATFKANSTLDWHHHSSVQVLIVVGVKAIIKKKGKTLSA